LYLGPIDFEPLNDTLPPTKDLHKLINPSLMPTRERLCLHLLQRGVATLVARVFILSMAHNKEDIEQTVRKFADSLDAMIEEGILKRD